MFKCKVLTCVVYIVVVLDGWVKRQIVFIVRVEAKQQFFSEIPYVGAILPLVSARIPISIYTYVIYTLVYLYKSPVSYSYKV